MARVAVLLGGLSPERPVSLSTGAGCVAALVRLGHDVIEIDPQDEDWMEQLLAARPDAAMNADPDVMRYFLARLTRSESLEMFDRLRTTIDANP